MKALIIYDSFFGNTEKIASSIGKELEKGYTVEMGKASNVSAASLADLQLLVVGSPTRAFSPTAGIKKFLKGIPAQQLNGVKIAAFDTRISPQDTNSALLNFLIKLFGYAAETISAGLLKKKGEEALTPAGFFVKGSEGPLKDGELQRAADWVKPLLP